MTPELRARLFKRFPRLYEHPDLFDFSPPIGWFNLLWNLGGQLESFDDLRVRQVKTKFGGLRFYYEPYNPKAQVLITAAETESATICEVCGNPGQQGSLEKTRWVVVRCREHEK